MPTAVRRPSPSDPRPREAGRRGTNRPTANAANGAHHAMLQWSTFRPETGDVRPPRLDAVWLTSTGLRRVEVAGRAERLMLLARESAWVRRMVPA